MNEFHSYRRAERAAIARWFFLATFLVLAVAFFRTQVVQHERFRLRAEKNRLRIVPLMAPRGVIYDRDGQILARNRPSFSVVLVPGDLPQDKDGDPEGAAAAAVVDRLLDLLHRPAPRLTAPQPAQRLTEAGRGHHGYRILLRAASS